MTVDLWRVVPPVLVLVLLAFAGLFALAEAALLALRASRVEQMVEEGRRGAESVRRITSDPAPYVATAQVGRTLLDFAAAAVAVLWATTWGDQGFEGAAAPRLADRVVGIVSATAATALLSMVLSGLVPKSVAMEAPDLWALRLAPFLRVCATVLRPISALVLGVSKLLAGPLGAKVRFQAPFITREELGQLIDSTGRAGTIDDDEAEIISRVIDFSETDIRAVMTPRIDMAAVPLDATLADTVERILDSGHSRLPVYEGSIDNVVGVLHAKDLLPLFAGGSRAKSTFDLRRIVRQPLFIPESRNVSEVLETMRRTKLQLAIVQDEYAGTEGLVTIEDLLEEIVGDIKDEYDRDEPEIHVVSETETLFDGRVSLDDVNDRLGTELEDDDYRTIGGWIQGALGHLPVVGEQVEAGGCRFVVEQVEDRRSVVRAIRCIGSGETGAGEDESSRLPGG
ncbi:MAG: hemolysin family protein [Armatimonadota bacterium]